MRKIAVVVIGGDEFGVDIEKAVEILRTQRVYHLPQLPSFFSGLINIRGDVIPLLDLRLRFGISSPSPNPRIIVVRLGSEKVGLVVDGVKEIIDLHPDEETGPPSIVKGLRAEYLTGLAKKGERIIILLNVETLLTSEEKLQIEEVVKTVGVVDAGNKTASG